MPTTTAVENDAEEIPSGACACSEPGNTAHL